MFSLLSWAVNIEFYSRFGRFYEFHLADKFLFYSNYQYHGLQFCVVYFLFFICYLLYICYSFPFFRVLYSSESNDTGICSICQTVLFGLNGPRLYRDE